MIVRNRTWPIGQSPDERVRQRTLPVSGSDGATVSFDFVGMGGVLDSRWTFSRAAGSGFLAGTGPTYIGADGLVKYATTNQPRFDYDPTTGSPRGLLIEQTATNLARYSEYIDPNAAPWNVYWFVAGTGASVTPVSQADPAGGTTASRCILGTSGSGRVYNGISTTAGVTYTLSFWAKSVSGTTSLALWHFNSATGNSTAVTIGTSWQRYQVTILGRTGNGFIECGIVNPTTNAATIDIWGLQLETGSGASSYIPTGSAIGTREQDTASFADAAAIGFDRRKGTLYFSGTQFKHASSFARSVRLAAAPGGSEPMGIAVNGSTFYGTARDASFVAFGDAIRTNTLLQPFAFAVAFNADTPSSVLRGSLNGSSVSVTQSSAAAPPTAAAVSMDLNSGSSATAYASMAIRSVKFWPTDKSLSELTSITS